MARAVVSQGPQQARRKPLEVLNVILREVAARLALVHMSSWVSQQTGDLASRWHRHIAKAERPRGSKLEYGMRCALSLPFVPSFAAVPLKHLHLSLDLVVV